MQFTKAIQPAGAVGEPGMQPVPTAGLARQPPSARGMRDSPDGRQLAEPQITARGAAVRSGRQIEFCDVGSRPYQDALFVGESADVIKIPGGSYGSPDHSGIGGEASGHPSCGRWTPWRCLRACLWMVQVSHS